MKRFILGMFLLMLVLSAVGCDIGESDQNFHFVTLSIIDVEVPDSFELNMNYDIQVTYERPNGCTFFQGFDVQNVDLTARDIAAIGSEITNSDTACTQAIEEVQANFAFRVLYDEPYVFRFYSGDDSEGNPTYLEYTIEVNPSSSNGQ